MPCRYIHFKILNIHSIEWTEISKRQTEEGGMSWQKRKYRDQLKGYTDLLPRNLPTYLCCNQYTLGQNSVKIGNWEYEHKPVMQMLEEREREKDRETEDVGAFSESVPTLLDGSETG